MLEKPGGGGGWVFKDDGWGVATFISERSLGS